ncbi:unnamed protein product [Mytilus edulis]|uniref:Uncharacterized protein n=1 Tax=Mytilus edulis TaxID=6550 RepID=A0A8S3UY37_MYTED|nr:unnamed protein product [Mytilus edulis]
MSGTRSIPYILATYLSFFDSTSCERTSNWDQCGCYWAEWQSWGTCNSECNGAHTRSRKIWIHHQRPGCALDFDICVTNSDPAWDESRCNAFCYNGGTSNGYSCSCVTGFYGDCCGHQVNCGNPGSISNGNLHGGTFTYGSTVRYTCHSGYLLVGGSSSRSCQLSELWSGRKPRCAYYNSCSSGPCKNGATCTNIPDHYQCTCTHDWSGKNCDVVNEQQHQDLQDDLDRLCDWSRKWKLSFNASKCKVMHFGQNNNLSRYTMLDNEDDYVQVNPVTEEKDLGITFEPNLKFDKHITNCVNKAQRVLALIRISFDYLEKDMFIILYKSIIRPLLEYSTTVWSPYLKKDIRRIEKIQRRATKLVPSIRMLSYVERLRALGLPTLEYRRDRYDMIQVYKALHGIDDIKWQNMFELSTNSTRGHPWKLIKKRCNSTQRLH